MNKQYKKHSSQIPQSGSLTRETYYPVYFWEQAFCLPLLRSTLLMLLLSSLLNILFFLCLPPAFAYTFSSFF